MIDRLKTLFQFAVWFHKKLIERWVNDEKK